MKLQVVWTTTWKLGPLLRRISPFTVSTKLLLYIFIIRTSLLCGSPTWYALTSPTNKKMLESWWLRTLIGEEDVWCRRAVWEEPHQIDAQVYSTHRVLVDDPHNLHFFFPVHVLVYFIWSLQGIAFAFYLSLIRLTASVLSSPCYVVQIYEHFNAFRFLVQKHSSVLIHAASCQLDSSYKCLITWEGSQTSKLVLKHASWIHEQNDCDSI